MHKYFKFGLLLIFVLNVSILHTQAQPAKNHTTIDSDDDYDSYDDYYDDQTESHIAMKVPEIAENRLTTTTTTFRPIFHIPRRSNHVLEPNCPRSCICREDYKYVQCAHARLTQVPHDLPRTALIIDLSHNAITELHAEDFANCSKVVEINLSSNQISHLDKEVFSGLVRLQRLRLTNNRLTEIAPDTFEYASDLSLLDLSNNSIALRQDGSFLNQPSLIELTCSNCSWTQLYDHTFDNLSSLTALRLHQNDFNRKINTRAFTPLRNLIKLKLPDLDQSSIQDLCNLLKSMDNISFKHFDISCFEFVLGTSFNESLIFATDPPFKRVTGLETVKTDATKAPPTTKIANNKKPTNMASNGSQSLNFTQLSIDTNETEIVRAGVLSTATEPSSKGAVKETEEQYQVPISPEAINTLLISIMVLAIIGIIIGLIFRKDVGGIKTKCCRTRKPEPKDQVHPTEEIPLNKIA